MSKKNDTQIYRHKVNHTSEEEMQQVQECKRSGGK